MSAAPLKLVDGLTIADELVVLHLYPRQKRDYSLGNITRSVVMAVYADLFLSNRVELYEPPELTWFRRAFYRNEGGHRFRVRLLDGAPPTGDELIDGFMEQIPGYEKHDLGWVIKHNDKLWIEFSHRLTERGVLGEPIKKHRGAREVDPNLEHRLRDRLRGALHGFDAPEDDHTGAVLLLAQASELFRPGSGERELVGPIDDA
ncbi:MAG: GPP34 family phosphoprotein, partial [Solirubrobacterales bacterium]|nr:GPP34 family phosphoprotein [Solirubrobacterales bacterium]